MKNQSVNFWAGVAGSTAISLSGSAAVHGDWRQAAGDSASEKWRASPKIRMCDIGGLRVRVEERERCQIVREQVREREREREVLPVYQGSEELSY